MGGPLDDDYISTWQFARHWVDSIFMWSLLIYACEKIANRFDSNHKYRNIDALCIAEMCHSVLAWFSLYAEHCEDEEQYLAILHLTFHSVFTFCVLVYYRDMVDTPRIVYMIGTLLSAIFYFVATIYLHEFAADRRQPHVQYWAELLDSHALKNAAMLTAPPVWMFYVVSDLYPLLVNAAFGGVVYLFTWPSSYLSLYERVVSLHTLPDFLVTFILFIPLVNYLVGWCYVVCRCQTLVTETLIQVPLYIDYVINPERAKEKLAAIELKIAQGKEEKELRKQASSSSASPSSFKKNKKKKKKN